MWICKYLVYFTVYSVMGWIYETVYVTIRTGKWSNRGFLYGPVVPIYGVGGVALTALCDAIAVYTDFRYTWWQVFIVSFLGSIVLEYSTSWLLEKLFHARWWDYNYMPFNINGRVCLPYSLAFGVAGLVVVYLVAPATRNALDWITPIYYELFAMLCVAAFSADTTLTVSALTDFDEDMEAMEENFNTHMEAFVQEVQERKKASDAVWDKHKEVLASKDPEAVSALFAEDVAAMEQRLAEERKRFANLHMEGSLAHMGKGRRNALSRVQSFSRLRVNKGDLQTQLQEVKARKKAAAMEKKALKKANRKQADEKS